MKLKPTALFLEFSDAVRILCHFSFFEHENTTKRGKGKQETNQSKHEIGANCPFFRIFRCPGVDLRLHMKPGTRWARPMGASLVVSPEIAKEDESCRQSTFCFVLLHVLVYTNTW